MSIVVPFPFERISQDAFRDLDYDVMEEAFRVHQELGPHFFSEGVYRNELAYRCEERGIKAVATEVPLRATFGSFAKTYFADLVVNCCAVYELKAVEAIHSVHERQALNYLLLANLAHGKVLNMRTKSMQHRFVSTNLTCDLRHRIEFLFHDWLDVDTDSVWFREIMQEMVVDWGAFLELPLYYDAIMSFRGGKECVIKPVNVVLRRRIVGTQPVHLLNPLVAFKITGLTKMVSSYERRLRRFLNMTGLRMLQWVNFNRHQVEFRTLAKV